MKYILLGLVFTGPLAAVGAVPLHAQTSEVEASEIEERTDKPGPPGAANTRQQADSAAARPKTTVGSKAASKVSSKAGWSIKPRGRIQVDAGYLAVPAGFTDDDAGFGNEVRRAYLGVDGKIPGGFAYRAEADFAGDTVEITDLYLAYSPLRSATLTLGQVKPFWGLEEMTSDLFTSFTERAAFNGAFGFERRMGASAAWSRGAVLIQGGVFTANLADLEEEETSARSYDARVVFMPKVGGDQLHLAGSFHYREFNDDESSVRYRAPPFIHTPDLRFTDTGSIEASSESGYGLEAAYIRGPFHAAGEAHWQTVSRDAGTNPTFFGGYAEAGYFLTGETRGYKAGAFDRTAPANPVGKGGLGALQINLRYDYLDLVDAGIVGGRQNVYGISLVWLPTAHTKLIANYGRTEHEDAALSAVGGSRDYGIDAFGVRAQFDF